MKPPLKLLLAAALAALPLNIDAAGALSNAAPSLQVKVDPRVELLSLIFRLAGNPEYSQAKVRTYAQDADKHFSGFRDHAVVRLAGMLRRNYGVSYDAVMSLAVHLKDAERLELAVPLDPWPAGLDARWKPATVTEFLAAARQFVRDARFKQFCQQHRGFYDTTARRLRELLEKSAHLEWYQSYFGERPRATFVAVPGLLNGGCCYGPHYSDRQGRETLYCILGVWKTDGGGLPNFTSDMLGTVVHEFCHSFANPIIARHEAELAAAGQKIFQHVAGRMRSQAYGNAGTMLRESLVRACTVRFHAQFDGAEAARRAAQSEASRGFVWTADLARLLEEYEGQREKYPTLESFAPRLVAFFNEYAREFAKRQPGLAAKPPKVISIAPANGQQNVAPGVTEIRVVFDRSMLDGMWAMCGGGPHFPETTGKPHYNAARTTWTVPVKLKPDWNYEFWLNSGWFDTFRSAEGVPLESVHVTFKTAPAK